ncbi:peptidoglycan DD-metalloendopeptidase family protein [Methylobacterium terrae]|nr:peptidoglycan DD-metalloendopeptidase family protein [Methylobacterium terrae]
MRTLSRFALIGLIGGASAACSTDAVRLDPFSNPFSSSASGEPGATGSLPEGEALTAPVRSAPIQSRPLSAPMAAAPLSSRPIAAPAATPRVAAAAPVTGGPAGWSPAGGTTITVGANDSLSQMSTRFGVPSAAILQANGLSSASQVTAGRQIVIPVYHAGGVPAMSARAVPAAPAPRVPVAETRQPESVRRVAEVAPRPEPAPEPARKAPARPGQAEARPVSPAAAERAAKLNARKPEPREEERLTAKPQRPEPKAVAKVAARQQDDEDERVAAKPQKAEPKAAAKPEVRKVEARKPEPHKPEAHKAEPKVAEKAKSEVKKVAEVKPEPRKVEAKPEVRKPEPKQAEAEKPEIKKPEVKKVAELKPAKPEPKPEPAKPVKVASLPEKAPEPAPAPAVAPAAPAPDPQSSFRWPARGRVINGYGSSGNEGINIAVPEGTPVKAAEEGTVAYAGSDVKGYGKLVLVRHANGYVSAYAHNGEIDVRPGEKVKRGQTIAKSGASGNVTSPQLHFEIRKGATPVDPMPHLASN